MWELAIGDMAIGDMAIGDMAIDVPLGLVLGQQHCQEFILFEFQFKLPRFGFIYLLRQILIRELRQVRPPRRLLTLLGLQPLLVALDGETADDRIDRAAHSFD